MKSIRDVVLSQKSEFEYQLKRLYVNRKLTGDYFKETDLIRVIIGPRRAGKSTLALHLLEKWGGGGYINFDDERLVGVSDADELLTAIDDIYQNPKNLLFDEIQNFQKWELLVNRLQRTGRRLLITGSNANLLASELATHLTGRHQAILLLPFSFSETQSMNEREPTSVERASQLERYIREGGYPEPLIRGANRTDYLRDLVRSTLHKDIVRRYKIRASSGLENMAHHYFSNVAKEFSYQTVAKIADITSRITAEKYTRMLCEAFLIFTITRLTFKARERAVSNKKCYVVDSGLAYCLGIRPGYDLGRLAENIIAIALWKKQMAGLQEVFFWRSQEDEEIDFVIRKNGKVSQLIQVCWDLSDPETKKREFRALIKGRKHLRCDQLICLTRSEEREENFSWHEETVKIKILSIEKWLLDEG